MMEITRSSKPVSTSLPRASKKSLEVDRGNGSFTVEERKEIISKRRIAEFKTMRDGTSYINQFLPRSPEQIELEQSLGMGKTGLLTAGLTATGFSALIYHKTIQESNFIAWTAIIFFIVSLMIQLYSFENNRNAKKRIAELDEQRNLLAPVPALQAYHSIVKNSQKIEDGDYPPSVVASARLSLEGVTNHLKLIGEYTDRGTVKSAPCQKLLHEVYRIASEMDAYLAVEKQEERKLAAAVRKELGPYPVESERADESIQQTEGLTF